MHGHLKSAVDNRIVSFRRDHGWVSLSVRLRGNTSVQFGICHHHALTTKKHRTNSLAAWDQHRMYVQSNVNAMNHVTWHQITREVNWLTAALNIFLYQLIGLI